MKSTNPYQTLAYLRVSLQEWRSKWSRTPNFGADQQRIATWATCVYVCNEALQASRLRNWTAHDIWSCDQTTKLSPKRSALFSAERKCTTVRSIYANVCSFLYLPPSVAQTSSLLRERTMKKTKKRWRLTWTWFSCLKSYPF